MNSQRSSQRTLNNDSSKPLSTRSSGKPVCRNCVSGEESDHISQRRCKLQQELVVSLKDDLSEWIVKTLGKTFLLTCSGHPFHAQCTLRMEDDFIYGPTNISSENFIQALDNGVILCQISLIIERKAKEYAEMGKYTSPLPSYKMHCNKNAKSGTWLARDNTANFLKWCRAYGLKDEHLFDSEDLVTHHKEMQVIYCLMELARVGARFGLEPPTLISLEEEIDSDSTVANIPPLPSHSPETSFDFSRVNSMEKSDVQLAEAEVEPLPSLETEVAKIAAKYGKQKHVKRLSMGLYLVFGKQVYIRLLKGKHLMVRVGGGWDTFENYLVHHATASMSSESKHDHTRSNTLPPRSGSRNLKQRQRSASLSSYSIPRKELMKTSTPPLVEASAATDPAIADPATLKPVVVDTVSQTVIFGTQYVDRVPQLLIPDTVGTQSFDSLPQLLVPAPVDHPSQTLIKALYSTASLVDSVADSDPHSVSPTPKSM